MVVHVVLRRLHTIQLAIRLYRTYKRIQRLQKDGGDMEAVDKEYALAGQDIRRTANRLCGAIVKAGQFLSLRAELFPKAFLDEIQQLQDNVPPVPLSDIRETISEACQQPIENVFRYANPDAIASGSIAQVHRAELLNGQVVAIKVLRPEIERLVEIDLSTLRHIARFVQKIPSMSNRLDFTTLHQVFATTLVREMDMRLEAAHMEQLRQAIGNDSGIHIPSVFDHYTTKRVLVMEFADGTSIRNIELLDAWHVNWHALRDSLLDAYVKQLLVTGFVHLDPHPGNVFVRPDGTLTLLDCGMVAEFRSDERSAFRNLIQCTVFRAIDGIVGALKTMGFVQSELVPGASTRLIEALVQQASSTNLRKLLTEEDIRLEARYMLLIRCLAMLKTVVTTLTPNEMDWPGVISERVLTIMLHPK